MNCIYGLPTHSQNTFTTHQLTHTRTACTSRPPILVRRLRLATHPHTHTAFMTHPPTHFCINSSPTHIRIMFTARPPSHTRTEFAAQPPTHTNTTFKTHPLTHTCTKFKVYLHTSKRHLHPTTHPHMYNIHGSPNRPYP